MSKVPKTAIRVELEDGKEIDLSLEQARKLYEALGNVFNTSPSYSYPWPRFTWPKIDKGIVWTCTVPSSEEEK